MLKRIWEGLVVDAPAIVIGMLIVNLFTDFEQGSLFGAMLLWVIFEILEIQLGITEKLREIFAKFSKKI
ncbi:putative membrane protein [Escherichia phage heid]|uniref:Putative membrane protein n=3 Tax=Felixounavirus TaxID=1198140 RepID=A0A6B9XCC1_9CAUD|nr:putative membrane protein [Escherichia phage garuso]QHR66642.1 putative membrane protein [Escherichia phage heid]QHR74230.1 putative membrane protein [Escherichia phage bumzen]